MLKMHGRMLIVGAMCALAALLALTAPKQADAQGTAAATAAYACGHHQLAAAKRSLSSAHSTLLQKKCAAAHKSLTTVNFLTKPKHHWMLAPRYDKWWQVPDKKWRRTVHHARVLLRYHKHRLVVVVRQIKVLMPKPQPKVSHDALFTAFTCIHRYEGAWNANTGNGYYGGLQMDVGFQSHYGSDFVRKWGTADNWPAWAQIIAAERAYRSGRGFYPWPYTAHVCGLI